ncbi:MAG TPA: type II secretion system protein GspJ [Nitrospiria bacterium]|nr:type II secretion system protein GspJ [Nitrospiria bacterium]
MKTGAWDDPSGFTLLELLIALGIAVVLVTLLYETFNAVLRSTQIVDQESEIDQMVRVSMERMTSELRSAYWRPSSDAGSASVFLFDGEDGTGGAQPADTLRFTTLSHALASAGNTDPSVSIVEYALIPDQETDTAVLMHREETSPLSPSVNSLEEYELGESVIGLNFRYFDGQDWWDQWNDADKKKLPKAVEIQLIIKDHAGQERRFITQTDIPIGQSS